MYQDLTEYQRLLLAIEFHLRGSNIPQELKDTLPADVIRDIQEAHS